MESERPSCSWLDRHCCTVCRLWDNSKVVLPGPATLEAWGEGEGPRALFQVTRRELAKAVRAQETPWEGVRKEPWHQRTCHPRPAPALCASPQVSSCQDQLVGFSGHLQPPPASLCLSLAPPNWALRISRTTLWRSQWTWSSLDVTGRPRHEHRDRYKQAFAILEGFPAFQTSVGESTRLTARHGPEVPSEVPSVSSRMDRGCSRDRGPMPPSARSPHESHLQRVLAFHGDWAAFW